MNRVIITETLALRIGNSLLDNEDSFWQAMKQKVLLEKILIANLINRIAILETLATRSGSSFSQERKFFLPQLKIKDSFKGYS